MDYKKHYDALINKRRLYKLAKIKSNPGTVETHHILPKSLGGSNAGSNIINLIAREHYFAHWLLYKMMPDNQQMALAFKLMVDINNGKRQINSRTYSNLKIAVSLIRSQNMINYYKSLSVEDRIKLAKQHSYVMQQYWERMTPEYKEYWCTEHSKSLSNMSPEKLAHRNEKYLQSLAAKSEQEQERIRKEKSDGSRKRWSQISAEELINIRQSMQGNNNVMRKMTDEQKLVFSLKVREGQSKWKNKIGERKYKKFCIKKGLVLQKAYAEWRVKLTEQERLAIKEKKINTYNSAPDEVKIQRSNKKSIHSKKWWKNMSLNKRREFCKKLSEAKRIKFTPEQDEYIKTHSVIECRQKFQLSAKPILRRRRELGIVNSMPR